MEKNRIKQLGYIFITGCVLIAIKPILAWITWKGLPPELPWFYSLPWGEGQLVSKTFIVFQSLGELLVWSGLSFVSKKVKPGDGEVVLAVMFGGLISLIFVLISYLKILQIFL